MKIVIPWRNPWIRIALYALFLLAALLERGLPVHFVYQAF